MYALTFTTTYRYASAVSHSHHVARLLPRNDHEQQLHQSSLILSPNALQRGQRTDFFGNSVDWFTLEESHTTLSLALQARVQINRGNSLLAPSEPWQNIAKLALQARSLDGEAPAHFLRPTQSTMADAAIALFAARFFTPQRTLYEAATALNLAIQSELTYDPEATDVQTTAADALARRAGVCQDFAHIMIAACRAAGVPARYVSGYIRTLAPPGQAKLAGADAMHAWVSLWMGPHAGWIGFDPTNGCLIENDHIVVAHGRDYSDTAPIRGEVVGGGEQHHTVAVDVIAAH